MGRIILAEKTKGDSFSFEFNLGEDITGFKIRAELFDNSGNEIKKASSNSGGSSDQIKINDSTNGVITIGFASGDTKNFDDLAFFELEVEDINGDITTVYNGKENLVKFKDQEIDWTTP